MLLIILFYFYISFLCWTFGHAFLNSIIKRKDLISCFGFSFTCLLGFLFITGFASIVSLFTGLDTPFIQLFFLAAALALLATKKSVYNIGISSFYHYSLPVKWLTATSIFLIIAMNAWEITHPDTLTYHQQIIQSIEEAGIIKGLAMENIRYGLQSNWFVACAVFSFKFTGSQSLTYINVALLVWLVLFIGERIQANIDTQTNTGNWNIILWLGLLAIAFWDYTQIRLTATSASPDFIIAIIVWCVFYSYITFERSVYLYTILILICVFSITIKLSALVIGILALLLFLYIVKQRLKSVLITISLSLLIIIPFVIRNVYTSGYILFPSPFPDIARVEWKVKQQRLIETNHYIKAYARTRSSSELQQVNAVNTSSLKNWVPAWWQLQSGAQKWLHLLLVTIATLAIAFIPRLINTLTKKEAIVLLTSIAGIANWWLFAPDLRFGYAFYIPFIGILLHALFFKRSATSLNILFVRTCIYALTLLIATYLVYRLAYYFDFINLLYPYGIK